MKRSEIRNCFLLQLTLVLCYIAANAQPEPGWQAFTAVKAKTDSMLKSAQRLLRKQQLDQGIAVINKIIPLTQGSSLDSTRGACFFLLGLAYRYKSKNDSAFYYYQKATDIAVRRKLISLRAAVDIEYYGVYNRLGKATAATAALDRLKEVLPLLDSAGVIAAKIEMYLGHDEKHHLRYTEALMHYYKSLRLFLQLKDSLNEANIYVSLANSLVDLGQQDKALVYHRQAAALFTLLHRPTELINELLNMTDTYYTSGQLDSGEVTAKRVLPLAISVEDKDAQAYVYMSLGNIYKRRRKFKDAESFLLKAARMAVPLDNDNLLIECYQGLGELYMADNQPSKATEWLEKHLVLAKRNNDLQEMIEASWDLSENEKALHHFEKAFTYKSQYSEYRDSSFRASSAKSNAEMESKYQAEKKEKQIAVLKTDQALQAAALQKEKTVRIGAVIFSVLLAIIALLVINRYRVIQNVKRLVEIEKLRNDIARDLHDDIGSALSSININSNMALTRSGETALVKTQLEKIKANSGKIMESMGDIVWSIHPANDSAGNLFIKMKEFLAQILEPLDINYHVHQEDNLQKVKLPIEKRKEIYLVFKEAVNNAAKYSQCSNIKIVLHLDAKQLTLQMEDDGIGFDVAATKMGNGLRNMQQRATAMGGQLEVNTTVGVGTTILLKIPVT